MTFPQSMIATPDSAGRSQLRPHIQISSGMPFQMLLHSPASQDGRATDAGVGFSSRTFPDRVQPLCVNQLPIDSHPTYHPVPVRRPNTPSRLQQPPPLVRSSNPNATSWRYQILRSDTLPASAAISESPWSMS